MIAELREFKNSGCISEKLGVMFMNIATHLSSKGCFYNYSYKRDMIRDAVARMVMQIDRFDPDHPQANPFWYFSQVAHRQFLTYIKSEKRYANTKEIVSDRYVDDLMTQTGMADPRLKFGVDDEDSGFSECVVVERIDLYDESNIYPGEVLKEFVEGDDEEKSETDEEEELIEED